jgi:hypothetical protein
MADNDNQKTVHTPTGMFIYWSNDVAYCKCCKADLTSYANKLLHVCDKTQLFNTALQYRQMLEDILNNVDVMEVAVKDDEDDTYEETILAKEMVNLAREVIGWEKV